MRREPHRVLQVAPDACPEVIEAAFGVLREMALSDVGPDAPHRLAELMRARGEMLARAEARAARER